MCGKGIAGLCILQHGIRNRIRSRRRDGIGAETRYGTKVGEPIEFALSKFHSKDALRRNDDFQGMGRRLFQ